MKNTRKNARLLLILLTFVLAMTSSISVMAKPVPTNTLMKEAAAAYEKDDFDTALAKFNEAYAQDPKSSILYNIGRVYESKAEFDNAISYYKQFITSPGSDEEARADALERIKKINETLEIIGGTTPSVPAKKAAKASAAAPAAAAAPVAVAAGGCIDINADPVSKLTGLKGVGDATANKIVSARPFKSVDDLNKVKGLGPAKIDKMRDQICPISGGATAVAAPAPATDNSAAKGSKTTQKMTKKTTKNADVLDI